MLLFMHTPKITGVAKLEIHVCELAGDVGNDLPGKGLPVHFLFAAHSSHLFGSLANGQSPLPNNEAGPVGELLPL